MVVNKQSPEGILSRLDDGNFAPLEIPCPPFTGLEIFGRHNVTLPLATASIMPTFRACR